MQLGLIAKKKHNVMSGFGGNEFQCVFMKFDELYWPGKHSITDSASIFSNFYICKTNSF